MNMPVDLTFLREITGGDTGVERELFDVFISSSAENLESLKTNCDPGKENAWRSQAHAFKGTSLNLGALILGHLCKEAQENYQAPMEKKRQMLAAIESEFGRVKEFLEKSTSTAG